MLHCRTLPSNLALCVHPDFVYVKAQDPASGRVYLVAESRLAELPGAVPKAKKAKKGAEETSQPAGFQVCPAEHPLSHEWRTLHWFLNDLRQSRNALYARLSSAT